MLGNGRVKMMDIKPDTIFFLNGLLDGATAFSLFVDNLRNANLGNHSAVFQSLCGLLNKIMSSDSTKSEPNG